MFNIHRWYLGDSSITLDLIKLHAQNLYQPQLKSKDAIIAQKEKEKSEIKTAMEGELKGIQADIEQVKKAHKSELDKVNSEMGEVIQRLGKREEVISKLEKEKREAALARDKALKQIEDIDKERDRLRENLSRLEGEKKSNNFGKYEKDRMKAELDKMVEERGKMSAKMEAVSAERNSLQQRVDDVGRGDSKNKEEWQRRGELLNRANAELQRSVEEANREAGLPG